MHGFGLKRTLASKLNIHPIDQHLCTEARCGWKANCGSREVPEYRFGAEENVGVKVERIDQHLVHGSNMLLEGELRTEEAGERRFARKKMRRRFGERSRG